MPSGINKIPTGILGFLGIKNFGRAPTALADFVQGTWELAPWYLNDNVRWFASSGGTLSLGNFINATVPLGEVWYVTTFGVAHNAAAASSNRVAPARFGQNTSNAAIMGPSSVCVASGSVAFGSNEPFILAPGESVGIACTEFTGTGQFGIQLRYSVMQA